MAFINQKSNVLVTGGAGFIGSNFILYLLSRSDFVGNIINVDKLSYAANLDNLDDICNHPRYVFYQVDIQDRCQIEKICINHKIDLIVHFAAETHVDNSIKDPMPFVMSNILGTIALLEIVKTHSHIHLHHISTDEVYGELSRVGVFSETSPYLPNSPYAASKASADHFVRAYLKTYQISATISNCCNNFGPRQHGEKLIPKMIENLIKKKPLTLYGRGENYREWIFVEDHSSALFTILTKAKRGESYNIGSSIEMKNLQMVGKIIAKYCEIKKESVEECSQLIQFVPDRPGHDFRYFLNSKRLNKLGFFPRYSIDEGLEITIRYTLKRKKGTTCQCRDPNQENLDLVF